MVLSAVDWLVLTLALRIIVIRFLGVCVYSCWCWSVAKKRCGEEVRDVAADPTMRPVVGELGPERELVADNRRQRKRRRKGLVVNRMRFDLPLEDNAGGPLPAAVDQPWREGQEDSAPTRSKAAPRSGSQPQIEIPDSQHSLAESSVFDDQSTSSSIDSEDDEPSEEATVVIPDHIRDHHDLDRFFDGGVSLIPAESKDSWLNKSCDKDLQLKSSEESTEISESWLKSIIKEDKEPFYDSLEIRQDVLQERLHSEPGCYKLCTLGAIKAHRAVAKVLKPQTGCSEIIIKGRSNIGKTFADDEVVVKVFQNKDISQSDTSTKHAVGKVIGIMSRNRFRDVKHPILFCTMGKWETALVKPLCKTVPKIYLQHGKEFENINRKSDRKFIEIYKILPDGSLDHHDYFPLDPSQIDMYVFRVKYLTWDFKGSRYPLGAVLGVHLTGKDFIGGLQLLAMQHQIPTIYPPQVVEETVTDMKVDPGERDDLTDRTVFTIDPKHSEDLDDALSVWKEDEHYIVGIHISDVAAWVKPRTALDEEARRRGTTYYPLKRKPHHMLPEPLVRQCSLLPGEKRLAVSVLFRFDQELNAVGNPEVKRTVIKSRCKLCYEDAQKAITEEVVKVNKYFKSVVEDIRLLFRIASKQREARLGEAAFYVPFSDPRLEGSEPNLLEAHRLVEELMIMTNSYIATRLEEKFEKKMLLRCQSTPCAEMLSAWEEKEGSIAHLLVQLQNMRITADRKLSLDKLRNSETTHPKSLIVQTQVWQQVKRNLDELLVTPESAADETRESYHSETKMPANILTCTDSLHPLQFLATLHWISMMPTAEYRFSRGSNGRDRKHFTLRKDLYTHFTSPIRRYADLYVQRLLHADLGFSCELSDLDEEDQLPHDLTLALRQQKAFGKDCLELQLASDLKEQPLTFFAVVEGFDTERMVLALPSLQAVSGKQQKIAFADIGISVIPVLTASGNVEIQWKKRIYRVKGICPGPLIQRTFERQNSVTVAVNVSREQLTVSLDVNDWQNILHCLIHNQPIDSVPQQVNLDRAMTVEYMSSERAERRPSQKPVCYKTTLQQGHLLKLQVSAEAKKGKLEITPVLLHIAKNSQICLQHIRDPVGTLVESAIITTQGKHFRTKKTYLNAWLPLLEMEAAVDAGEAEDGVVVDDVTVKMKSSTSGQFSLDVQFCIDRGISLGGKIPDGLRREDGKKAKKRNKFAMDYLCLRCCKMKCSSKVVSRIKQGKGFPADQYYTWLAHAWVTEVSRRNTDGEDGVWLEVRFSLCSSAVPAPDFLLRQKRGIPMTVEILPKSEVERLAQEMLQNIGSCSIARSLAYKKNLPSLDEARRDLGSKKEYHEVFAYKPAQGMSLPRNNERQREAIVKALTNSVSLIQGPPGTGKTYTGIKIIKLFTQINRKCIENGTGPSVVLFCGPSNKAVDNVARLLKVKLGPDCPKILRIYSTEIELEDLKLDMFRSRRSISDAKCPQDLQDISLHRIIRQSGKPKQDEIVQLDRLLRQSNTAPLTLEIQKKYKKLVFEACREEMKHYEVLLTTCAVAGSQRVIQGAEKRIFQVMIDECGMCTEPHSMIPVIANNAQQVVLIGDHQQLRPIITCPKAASLGLDQSLFQRLYSKFPDERKTFLNEQYRMHPDICEFPSKTFYDGKLVTRKSTMWFQPPLAFWPTRRLDSPYPFPEMFDRTPLIFVDVRGLELTLTVSTEQGNERSKSNLQEADKVVDILDYMVSWYGVGLRQIRVLTQYNAQRHLLKEKITRRCEQKDHSSFDTAQMEISTVVSSQGGEWDYVILSTVRSQPSENIERQPTDGWCKENLGFITDRNQVNVALTRARKGLIIVGNAELLKCDEVWRDLLQMYQDLGCLYSAPQFPPPVPHFERQHSVQLSPVPHLERQFFDLPSPATGIRRQLAEFRQAGELQRQLSEF